MDNKNTGRGCVAPRCKGTRKRGESMTNTKRPTIGSKVMVYHDPITCKDPEGVAELREMAWIRGHNGGGVLENWRVRFTDSGPIVNRTIRIKR